jgi:CheY-like chemotaxis protein
VKPKATLFPLAPKEALSLLVPVAESWETLGILRFILIFHHGRYWHIGCTNSKNMRLRGTPLKGIVLISHDKDLRRQVHTCLSTVGMPPSALTTVRNGDEGLAALSKGRARLVVLDDSISDLDGPRLLRALHQRVPEALVVYLTSHHTLELERTVRQLGVLYYTEKPPDSWLFEKVLATVLAATAVKPSGDSSPYRRGTWGAH